jgi:hypothetical protein
MRELSKEPRKERHTASLLGESTHLVIGLGEIQTLDGAQCSTGIVVFTQGLHETDGVDGYGAFLDTAVALAKVSLLKVSTPEEISTIALRPFNSRYPVDCVHQSVIEILFGEASHAEALHGFIGFALVGREVRMEFRADVVRHDGHEVFGL